jgi:hypothetical protein
MVQRPEKPVIPVLFHVVYLGEPLVQTPYRRKNSKKNIAIGGPVETITQVHPL